MWLWAAAGVVVIAALAVLGTAYFGRKRLNINRITVRVPGLPQGFQGKRMVWFTDVHLGPFYSPGDLRSLVGLINEQKPDLIGFGGDFLENRRSLPLLRDAITELKALYAPLGKFAILGNHDYKASAKRVVEALDEAGFEVLVNRTAVVVSEGDRLPIVGLDDVLSGRPLLRREAKRIAPGHPAILLVHEPDPAPKRGEHSFALQLSGHSHGGQVRMPFLGPIMTTRYGKRYAKGFYPTAFGGIYTSPGIGTTFLPFRFFCRAEIAVLTFVRQ